VDPTGNLYVTDWGNYTIRKITPAGVVTTLAGRAGIQGSADGVGSDARFSYPSAIAVDSTGNLFVSDYDAIRKITPTGTVSTLAGVVGVPGDADGTGASARFNSPWRLTINGAGNLYVCDYSNGIIRKVTQSGVVTTLPIAPDTIGSPEGIAFDGFGNLYIADNSNSVIFKYGVSGTLSVLAGLGDVTGNADGTGAAARFNRPTDLASDGSGNIYVVDANDSTVRRITPTGVVTTLAGAAGIPGSADGVGYGARFNFFGASPGIAVDNSGVIYLADEPNNTIRKGIPSATPTPTAWLTNFAGRAFVDSTIARGNLTAGFVTTGSFPKQVLVRAIGPGLQPFGVTGVLANPSFTVYQGSTAGQTVTGWNSSLVGLFQSLGAFPLASGSNDAATQATFNPGAYTAIVSSADGTQSGNAMVELYDADSAAPTVRLVNASALAFVGAGGRILIGGFVMDGSGSETVLIRGVGPTLGALGVTGSLAQPWLQVFDREGTVIASIKGWGGAPTAGASSISAGLQPASTAIMNAVGAFSLPNGSADSAMVLTLPVGAYTAFVQSANGGSGVALLEIYEVR
jgi:sugar lactone lactonase YvrE